MGAEQSHTRKKVHQSEHSSDSESYGSGNYGNYRNFKS